MRNSRGFSLIEVLAVIGLVAAVTIVALPQLLNARDNYRLTSAANDVVSRLLYARVRAISRSSNVRIVVASATTYTLQEQTSPGVWTDRDTYRVPAGYSIMATGTAEFHSRGNATPIATFTITNPNSETRNVIVTSAGRVYAE